MVGRLYIAYTFFLWQFGKLTEQTRTENWQVLKENILVGVRFLKRLASHTILDRFFLMSSKEYLCTEKSSISDGGNNDIKKDITQQIYGQNY